MKSCHPLALARRKAGLRATGSRGAITGLIGAMDDAIDEMHAAAGAVDLYEVQAFDPEMKDMTANIMQDF